MGTSALEGSASRISCASGNPYCSLPKGSCDRECGHTAEAIMALGCAPGTRYSAIEHLLGGAVACGGGQGRCTSDEGGVTGGDSSDAVGPRDTRRTGEGAGGEDSATCIGGQKQATGGGQARARPYGGISFEIGGQGPPSVEQEIDSERPGSPGAGPGRRIMAVGSVDGTTLVQGSGLPASVAHSARGGGAADGLERGASSAGVGSSADSSDTYACGHSRTSPKDKDDPTVHGCAECIARSLDWLVETGRELAEYVTLSASLIRTKEFSFFEEESEEESKASKRGNAFKQVGTAARVKSYAGEVKPGRLPEAKFLCPELNNWFPPDQSPEAEKNSLYQQTRGYAPVDEPEGKWEVIERCFKGYPRQNKVTRESWRARARVALMNVKRSSGPGFPYLAQYSTNAAVIAALGEEHIIELTVQRIELLESAPWELFEDDSITPLDMVMMGLCDPVKVFVKGELHSAKKVAEKRMRIICSVSLIDQMVERVLNEGQNSAEIFNFEHLASKPGMGLHDEGLAHVNECWAQMDLPAGTDISKWDLSVPQWLLDWDASRRAWLSGHGQVDKGTLYHKRARLLGWSLVVFSDGEIWRQTRRGLQKSGSYNTSASNSACRVMACAKVTPIEFILRVIAMGDDAGEDAAWVREWLRSQGLPCDNVSIAQELIRRYASLGFVVKEAEVGFPLEFCAYSYHGAGEVHPTHWDKMVAKFFWSWPSLDTFADRLLALQFELRHSPHYERVMQVIAHVYSHAERGGAQ